MERALGVITSIRLSAIKAPLCAGAAVRKVGLAA